MAGLASNGQKPPSDEEGARWLDEHRTEKYGSVRRLRSGLDARMVRPFSAPQCPYPISRRTRPMPPMRVRPLIVNEAWP